MNEIKKFALWCISKEGQKEIKKRNIDGSELQKFITEMQKVKK